MALLQVPADDGLGPGLVVGRGDLTDDGVRVVDLALAQRSPGFDPDVIGCQHGTSVDLLELRVALDLVDSRDDAGVEDLRKVAVVEVRYADRGGQPLVAVGGEGLPGFDGVLVLRGRPVDEVEVDVVEAELFEALAQRPLGLFGTVAVVPQLRGDEELVAGDPGLRNRSAHALLIAVDGCRVDVAVADFEGIGDDALGLLGVDLEDTEAQLRDRLAVVEGECGNRQGAAFRHGLCGGLATSL